MIVSDRENGNGTPRDQNKKRKKEKKRKVIIMIKILGISEVSRISIPLDSFE